MSDGDVASVGFGCFESVVFFEHVDEGMLPVGNRLHLNLINFINYNFLKSILTFSIELNKFNQEMR